MTWDQLRTLTIEFGPTYITFYDFFYLTSHAPQLKAANVQMNIRMKPNANLLLDTSTDTLGYEIMIGEVEAPHTLCPTITRLRTTCLQTLDFRGSPLRFFDDQMFLLHVLRELAPNLTLSRKMLHSLDWVDKKMGNLALSYLMSPIYRYSSTYSHWSNLLSYQCSHAASPAGFSVFVISSRYMHL